MSDEPPPTCICPIFNQECFEQSTDTVEPYNYNTIYLKFPDAQAGEIMSETSMPQSVFDIYGNLPSQFKYLTSTGVGTAWSPYGNQLGIIASTQNTGVPLNVLTPIVLPEGSTYIDVFVIGQGGPKTQTPPPFFSTSGTIVNVAENGNWGSGACVYFPKLPVAQFSVLLSGGAVQFYIDGILIVTTFITGTPTNGTAFPPSQLTPGIGGTGGGFTLSTTQYPYLASNGVQGKDGRVISVPLNTATNTLSVSNLITGNLTKTQFNSTSGVTNVALAGTSGVMTYSFPNSSSIQHTNTFYPGGVICRCYAY